MIDGGMAGHGQIEAQKMGENRSNDVAVRDEDVGLLLRGLE